MTMKSSPNRAVNFEAELYAMEAFTVGGKIYIYIYIYIYIERERERERDR